MAQVWNYNIAFINPQGFIKLYRGTQGFYIESLKVMNGPFAYLYGPWLMEANIQGFWKQILRNPTSLLINPEPFKDPMVDP